MSKTFKDKDFRKLRKAGKRLYRLELPNAPTVRAELGKSLFTSEDGYRLLHTYTKHNDLYTFSHRRHSAAHRDSARKTRHDLRRAKKHSENNKINRHIIDTLRNVGAEEENT